MRTLFFFVPFFFLAAVGGNTQSRQADLPACEWCGAMEAPDELSWKITLPKSSFGGEQLVVKGTVFRTDGTTPAPDVILYVYHTNARGLYEKRGGEKGNARRHGRLRGWMKTNDGGQYEFTTIRPGTYPSRSEPAHIHITVKEPDREEYWIDDFQFDDDAFLTPQKRSRQQNRGGSGILKLKRDEQGIWHGHRDIILPD